MCRADKQYKGCRTMTENSELSLAVFNTMLQLSSQPRGNPKARHQCRSLCSARMRPKLQDQPGHRGPWCLERCGYHSQTLGLPVQTDTELLLILSASMCSCLLPLLGSSDCSPCWHTQPLPCPQGSLPLSTAHEEPHSGPRGVKTAASVQPCSGQCQGM